MSFLNRILIFLLASFFCFSCASNKSGKNKVISEGAYSIKIFSNSSDLPVDSIINSSDKIFAPYQGEELSGNKIYWLKISIDNSKTGYTDYYIHFNNNISYLSLYQPDNLNKYIEKKGGVMIPETKRSAGLLIRDIAPFYITPTDSTTIYLKILKKVNSTYSLKSLDFISFKEYIRYTFNNYLLQSFFIGLVFILCFFNLILFFLNHDKLHLYYFIYAVVTSLYFLFYFQIIESFIFFNSPKISSFFFFSLTISQPIYCWFLFQALKNENIDHWKKIIQKYATVISATAIIIISIPFFNRSLAVHVSDIYSIINSLFFIAIIFFLYKKVSKTIRIIFIGSAFLVAGGLSGLITNFQESSDIHIYFYQLGFVIELLFFTLAINYMHRNERMEKINALLRNSILETENLKNEKQAKKLQDEVDSKNRDLASKVVIISEKEELLKNIINDLSGITDTNRSLGLNNIIANLKANLNRNNWQEFEAHFNNVHPRFYELLSKKYPGLTANERKLCAFLKLNLSTKEISVITGKSQNTIDVARSRLRKKMELKPDANLTSVIANIS